MSTHKIDLELLQERYKKVTTEAYIDSMKCSSKTSELYSDEAISMAKTQLLNILHNVREILQVIDNVQDFEPWMTGMLTSADGGISKLKSVVLFKE
jgi:hypothetical protein